MFNGLLSECATHINNKIVGRFHVYHNLSGILHYFLFRNKITAEAHTDTAKTDNPAPVSGFLTVGVAAAPLRLKLLIEVKIC